MITTIRVVIVDPDAALGDDIYATLALNLDVDYRVMGVFDTAAAALPVIFEHEPDVLLIEANLPGEDSLAVAQRVRRSLPNTQVVMTAAGNDTQLMRQAMGAGVRDWLPKPFDAATLHAALYAAVASQRRPSRQPPRPSPPAPPIAPAAPPQQAQIILCYSPVGGVGTTTLASNIAVGLVKRGKRVLLVDGKLQFGAVNIFLNITSDKAGRYVALDTLAGAFEAQDAGLWIKRFPTHVTGVHVLGAPHDIAFAEHIMTRHPLLVRDVVRGVRSHYDFIVVDAGTRMDEAFGALLDMAGKVVMVTTPSLHSVGLVRRAQTVLEYLIETQRKLHLVVNRVDVENAEAHKQLSVKKIETFTKTKATAAVPYAPAAFQASLIKGVPITATGDDSLSPARELHQLVDVLLADGG